MSDSDRVIYLIEGKYGENKKLWKKDVTLSYNGVISVGRCFTLVCPDKITNYIQNDIPIVSIDGGFIVLNDPNYFKEIPISNQIGSNMTHQ